jgi:cytidine deaminase
VSAKASRERLPAAQPIEALDKRLLKLVRMALRARKRAYAPYSRFQVGCAIRDGKGKIHTGCNVENASYPATICAERTAIAKMVSRGSRDIKLVVVATPSEEPCFPCGVCLQVISEFGRDASVLAVNGTGTRFRTARMSDLYPASFSKSFLKA